MEEEQPALAEGADVSRIKNRIASLVEQRFAKGGATYYLSQLGIDLGADRQLIERLTGKKLAEFVRSQFDFEIVRTGRHDNVLHIAQQGAVNPTIQAAASTLPRYMSRFWAAFAIPLREGERRFIDLVTLSFGPDESALRKFGRDIREIRAEFTSSGDVFATPAEIARRIDAWLVDEGLDPIPFLARPRSSSRDMPPSLLEQLLNALGGEQLKRVSLPLDVIRTLSERRDR